jgi:hypothetical protein
MQPGMYSEDTFKMKFGRTRRRLQKYSKSTVLDYKELRGLSDPGIRDYTYGLHLKGYEVGHGPRPILVVTTCSLVELLIQ